MVELWALKALELDDALAEGHSFLGIVKYNRFDWAGAEKEIKRALELDPNSSIANGTYFHYLSGVGRVDEALFYAIRANELDSTSSPGQAYLLARQYDKAIDLWLKAKRSDKPSGNHLLAEAYIAKGMYEEGVAEMRKVVALDNSPERWDKLPLLAYAYAVAGHRDEALKILDEQEKLAKRGYISPYNFAIIYTGLGDKDRAFEWLEKCYEQRTRLVYRIKSRPMFDPLRSDPRYVELLRKMNLAP